MTLDEAIKRAEEVMVENLEKIKGRNASDPIAINYFKYADIHRQLAEWLKELKQLREQTSWIPVTKRLPDDYDRYLITTDDGMVEIVDYGYIDNRTNEIAFHEWNNEGWQCWKPDVTAWMPRPKAYKAERSDKE